MALRIVRNDITRMQVDAVVNTASEAVQVGAGCDYAIYNAAGYDELLAYRRENIGEKKEGEAFFTPGFKLPARYIIHTVSPLFRDGNSKEEEKLRDCYRNSLEIAKKLKLTSVAFPIISTGSFGYPKEEGLRIAIDEVNAFLNDNDIEVFLVVYDERTTELGRRIAPDLEEYIGKKYVSPFSMMACPMTARPVIDNRGLSQACDEEPAKKKEKKKEKTTFAQKLFGKSSKKNEAVSSVEGLVAASESEFLEDKSSSCIDYETYDNYDFSEYQGRLEERFEHMSDTFSEYLLYLIQSKNMENAEVYKRAIVDKKVFSKIKNNPDYHPQKLTALCLCIGAKLNLDEARDLLMRAGYALSPCDKTDIIFSYFIENGIYDMIELDIQLEEHGLNCIIA